MLTLPHGSGRDTMRTRHEWKRRTPFDLSSCLAAKYNEFARRQQSGGRVYVSLMSVATRIEDENVHKR